MVHGEHNITISTQTILRIVVVVCTLWFLYLVRDILALLMIAVIIAAALGPIITVFQRWHIPRALTVTLVYVAFFAILSLLVSFIVPSLTAQLNAFAERLTQQTVFAPDSALGMIFGTNLGSANVLSQIHTIFSGSFGDVFSRTASVFSVLVAVLATLSMAFYMSLQKDGIKHFLVSLTPQQHQAYVISLAQRIQENFGRWMAGQVVTMVFVGVFYYIILALLGVPYALVLAVLGGLLEIVPYLGPVLSVIPAAMLGFSVSPMVGFGVLAGYMLVNLVENHILIPQIMNKAVGLNPVAVILALLVGAKIAGLIGVIIAVPLAGAVSLFVKDVLERKIG